MTNSYQKYSDAELLIWMQKDDQMAFTEIYNRYWDRLFIVAGNKLEDCFLAQEVVQDLFVKLWQRRHELVINYSLATYLSAALKYSVINARNKRNRRLTNTEFENNEIEDQHSDVERFMEFEELQDRLAKLVHLLPEKCRLVYELSRDEGHSTKEIAKELQLSEKTVEAHITRALKKIKEGLQTFQFQIWNHIANILEK